MWEGIDAPRARPGYGKKLSDGQWVWAGCYLPETSFGRLLLTSWRILYLQRESRHPGLFGGSDFRVRIIFPLSVVGSPGVVHSDAFWGQVLLIAGHAFVLGPSVQVAEVISTIRSTEATFADQLGSLPPIPEAGETSFRSAPASVAGDHPFDASGLITCPLCHAVMMPVEDAWQCPNDACEIMLPHPSGADGNPEDPSPA